MYFHTAPLQLEQLGLWHKGIRLVWQVEGFKTASVRGFGKLLTISKMAAL